MDSSGDIWKIIYLGFEKSQRSVTHDILRYINILTYLLLTSTTDQGVGFVVHEALCLSVQWVNAVDQVEHLYTTRPLQHTLAWVSSGSDVPPDIKQRCFSQPISRLIVRCKFENCQWHNKVAMGPRASIPKGPPLPQKNFLKTALGKFWAPNSAARPIVTPLLQWSGTSPKIAPSIGDLNPYLIWALSHLSTS